MPHDHARRCLMSRTLLAFFAAAVNVWPSGAEAEKEPAKEREDYVGDSYTSLPGIARVGLPVEGTPGASFALSAGYGWTESQTGPAVPTDGSHHRLRGIVGIGLRPINWLSFVLRMDGRYDRHPRDTLGKDDGYTGEPRLGVRFAKALSRSFTLGAQVDVWVPGGDAPSFAFKATSVDMLLMGAYSPLGLPGLTLGLQAGFRVDQSAKAISNPDSLRVGDRLALGLSDFHAVLVGTGASYRMGSWEWLAEFTLNALVGSGAPDFGVSPMFITGGVRYHGLGPLQMELLLEGSPSKRPLRDVGQPLVPVEPRVSVMLGLRYRLPFRKAAQSKGEGEGGQGQGAEQGPKAVVTANLEGRVVDPHGDPIVNAEVKLEVAQTSREATTDGEGRYRFDDLPAGTASLTVRAEGYEELKRELLLESGRTLQEDSTLAPAVPAGQIRGMVLSFSGKPVQATVRIEPGGKEAKTSEDGDFEVEVQPGTYEVTIEAPGFQSQKRSVKVQERGVTVLNVDLRRSK